MNAAILILAMFCLAGCVAPIAPGAGERARPRKIPVILDTDIGDDIDDTWALVMLLKSPQFGIKLITTTNGAAEYRARIIARLLTVAGRTDVPIGLGAGSAPGMGKQQAWIEDFPLSHYAGAVHHDGVGALIDTIHRSAEPITIIAIGPLQTLAAALARDPSIAPKAHLVGMQGSVYKGYGGAATPAAEYNVKTDIAAARKVLSAPWRSICITPLDTCGLSDVKLDGPRFQSLQRSSDPLLCALLDNYRIWSHPAPAATLNASTTLYDTVAVCLADLQCLSLLNLKSLKISVTDTGMTAPSADGTMMTVATSWNDLEAFRDYLSQILLR